MGTMEGFLLGQAVSPTPEYNSGPIWKARAQQEESNALWWKAEAEKLSASLDKEHKRFVEERKERRSYMRGWAVRGQFLREQCGYSNERLKEESVALSNQNYDSIEKTINKKDNEVDKRSGFPDTHPNLD